MADSDSGSSWIPDADGCCGWDSVRGRGIAVPDATRAGDPPSTSIVGRIRPSSRGRYQARSPSSDISAGPTHIRTRNASTSTPTLKVNPAVERQQVGLLRDLLDHLTRGPDLSNPECVTADRTSPANANGMHWASNGPATAITRRSSGISCVWVMDRFVGSDHCALDAFMGDPRDLPPIAGAHAPGGWVYRSSWPRTWTGPPERGRRRLPVVLEVLVDLAGRTSPLPLISLHWARHYRARKVEDRCRVWGPRARQRSRG